MMKYFRNLSFIRTTILACLVVVFVASAVVTSTIKPKPAEAICCSSCCMCLTSTLMEDLQGWLENWFKINLHLFLNLLLHRYIWWDWTFWQQYLMPAMQMAGTQVAAIGTNHLMIVGMFIDAKAQLDSQRLLQELQAKAHKDYHPSEGVCEFGTRIKSLASSERKGEMNALLLNERSLDRYLGGKGTGSSKGQYGDIELRLRSFKTMFCDVKDNAGSLSSLCTTLQNPTPEQRARLNKDVDFQRTLYSPMTVPFNLTEENPASETDTEIFALASNLYGFDSFERPKAEYLKSNPNSRDISQLQKSYLDMRAVIAKMNVAENSFNALVALKSEGTPGSKDFIAAYLRELGVPETELESYLGENPSYHAQMEILTKLAYQTPLFYTNLYDKPANVERKSVALQAVSLIQKFDLLESYLRTEASLSILLELTVEELQREVEDNIQAYTPDAKIQ